MHFGHRVTSRVEGSHNVLKGYLQVSTGDLKFVLDNIQIMLLAQHMEIEGQISSAKLHPGHDLQIELFSEVLGRVTPFALRKILQQHRIMRSPKFNSKCSRLFQSSMGLLCAHQLKQLHDSKEAIQIQHIHRHWHFHSPDQPLSMQPLIRNPEVAITRGRPTANKQPKRSTRRDPSQFEVQQLQQRKPKAKKPAKTKPNMKAATHPPLLSLPSPSPPLLTPLSSLRPRHSRHQLKQKQWQDDSEDRGDSEEDRLMAIELQRLRDTNGAAEPLWANEPEFAGFSRATRAYAPRNRGESSRAGDGGK